MRKPEQTEQEYVEKIVRLMREGALRGAFRRIFGFGVIVGLVFLLMAGGTLVAYLRLGGSKDDWRFIFGFITGALLCPAIVVFGDTLADILKDISSREERPFTLMVKYHNHLLREGLDPYEQTDP